MTEDWGAQAIIDAFPRDGHTYFLQFISEPTLIHKEAQGGRKYTQLTVRLQFFALTETGEYEYVGWGEKQVQPCVFEDFTAYRHILLDACYKVTGSEHKKHVDLFIDEAFDRQQASEGYAPKTVPTSQPTKLGDVGAPAPASNPATICEAHAILKCPSCHPEEWS